MSFIASENSSSLIFGRKNALDGIFAHFQDALQQEELRKALETMTKEEVRGPEGNLQSGFDIKTDIWTFSHGRVEVTQSKQRQRNRVASNLIVSEMKFVHQLCDREGKEYNSDEVGNCVYIEVLRRKPYSYDFKSIVYTQDCGYSNKPASLCLVAGEKAMWFADNTGEFIGGQKDMKDRIKTMATQKLYFDQIEAYRERLFNKNGVFYKKEYV